MGTTCVRRTTSSTIGTSCPESEALPIGKSSPVKAGAAASDLRFVPDDRVALSLRDEARLGIRGAQDPLGHGDLFVAQHPRRAGGNYLRKCVYIRTQALDRTGGQRLAARSQVEFSELLVEWRGFCPKELMHSTRPLQQLLVPSFASAAALLLPTREVYFAVQRDHDIERPANLDRIEHWQLDAIERPADAPQPVHQGHHQPRVGRPRRVALDVGAVLQHRLEVVQLQAQRLRDLRVENA